jgi:hypothetical protein
MPERWLAEIQKIGRMEPTSDDLMERAERGPFLAEPRARTTSRLTAGLFAVVIIVAGGWMAYAALSGTGGQQPLGDGASEFVALWPETSFADAQQVQALVDAGDATVQWRTDPSAVALHYGRDVLGWSIPLASETAANDPDIITVSVHGLSPSCEGHACSAPPQPGVTLTLQRLVRSGDGGIWSVTAVDSDEPTNGS